MNTKERCINILHAAFTGLALTGMTMLTNGCDMIEYHPYDLNIKGDTDINRRNIQSIEASLNGKEEVSFILISDTQRWYDETEDAVNAINERNDVDFVIHCGDLSDFGMKMEFEKQRDILNRLNVPYVCLLGNHDCLGTGEETYKAIFGPANFSFIAGGVKFVCLNTNALEYDYSEPVPDFTFMENEIKARKDEFDHTVVCMHARPYTDVFNDNVAKVFQRYVIEYPGILFCSAAHTHHYEDTVVFDDGIHYITTDCMKERTYIEYDIFPDNENPGKKTYTYKLVHY